MCCTRKPRRPVRTPILPVTQVSPTIPVSQVPPISREAPDDELDTISIKAPIPPSPSVVSDMASEKNDTPTIFTPPTTAPPSYTAEPAPDPESVGPALTPTASAQENWRVKRAQSRLDRDTRRAAAKFERNNAKAESKYKRNLAKAMRRSQRDDSESDSSSSSSSSEDDSDSDDSTLGPREKALRRAARARDKAQRKAAKSRAKALRKGEKAREKAARKREKALQEAALARERAQREGELARERAAKAREEAQRAAEQARERAAVAREQAIREAEMKREKSLREAELAREKAQRKREKKPAVQLDDGLTEQQMGAIDRQMDAIDRQNIAIDRQNNAIDRQMNAQMEREFSAYQPPSAPPAMLGRPGQTSYLDQSSRRRPRGPIGLLINGVTSLYGNTYRRQAGPGNVNMETGTVAPGRSNPHVNMAIMDPGPDYPQDHRPAEPRASMSDDEADRESLRARRADDSDDDEAPANDGLPSYEEVARTLPIRPAPAEKA